MTAMKGKILSLYGRGMTTRDIQAQLEDMYGVEVSATLISEVTDAVIDEVKTWQARPLAAVYPLYVARCLRLRRGEALHRQGQRERTGD